MCTKCSENLIGVEFDYLFICSRPEIVNLRVRYIPNYYLINSNAEHMAGMLSLCHIELLTNLSRLQPCCMSDHHVRFNDACTHILLVVTLLIPCCMLQRFKGTNCNMSKQIYIQTYINICNKHIMN
jgi:hypothetical protein